MVRSGLSLHGISLGFDPNADVGFNIGKIPGFPWGERPFYGYMSEVRVWSVARSENQIKQNMLSVDPKSDAAWNSISS